MLCVTYFDQHLVTAHSKRWYAGPNTLFHCFLQKAEKAEKGRKSKKISAKFSEKMFFFFKFAPQCWPSDLHVKNIH